MIDEIMPADTQDEANPSTFEEAINENFLSASTNVADYLPETEAPKLILNEVDEKISNLVAAFPDKYTIEDLNAYVAQGYSIGQIHYSHFGY